MLADHPHVLSDERQTRVSGKDTGRFWDAGASLVHWVIGTDDQIEEGIHEALRRVRAPGVFVEGGSFLKYVNADYSLMVAGPDVRDIKSSAVGVMAKMNALLVTRTAYNPSFEAELRRKLLARGIQSLDVPIVFEDGLHHLVTEIRERHERRQDRS
jgi:hypothetical protein